MAVARRALETKRDALGIPGARVTATSLHLPYDLSYNDTAEVLRTIGAIGRSSSWWILDALLYAEERFPESQFSQLAEELGLRPHTLLNMLSVGRAWPPARRREGLEFGHHEALAGLEAEDQEHWANLAEEGEVLVNQERKRWSVSRLRQELRALRPGKEKEGMRERYVISSDRLRGVVVYVEGREIPGSDRVRSLTRPWPNPVPAPCSDCELGEHCGGCECCPR
jgi:hypothetical protein